MIRIDRQLALVLLVVILLLAAALRLPDLSQMPPGPHYDEAANGILAGDIGVRGDRPVFISSYTGKEVLFFYLAGGMMGLVGESVFTLRLTAALVGLLTIAATYWLGREMKLDRRVVLIGVILLAVSFWHLLFSRLGFRAITQPLLQALTLGALLRGLRRDHNGWLALAGLFLGLTAYTYLAARLFPLLLFVALLPLMTRRHARRQRSRQILLTLFIGLLVLTPLLWYFSLQPEAFWVRITQVAPADSLTLGESLLKSLQMFFLVGDPYIRFNLPNRPLFNSFWGTLMLIGWLFALWRWPRLEHDWERTVVVLLCFNPLIMILPTALATSEIVPSNLRAIGLIPLIFFLPGGGLLILLQSVENWLHSRMVTVTVLAVGLIVLLLGGLTTNRLYFREWAAAPALFLESDGDLAAVSHYLNGRDLAEKSVFVAAAHYQHPTVAFLSDAYEQIKWLPRSQAMVFPATGPALYVFPENSPFPDWVTSYLADELPPPVQGGSESEDPFTVYEIGNTPDLTIPRPVQVNFGDVITLIGYSVDAAHTGETMPVTLFWRVDGTPAAAFASFVHLEDQWRQRWSQLETDAYPAEQWQVGDTIVQRVELPVPPGAPPGPYRLRIGQFDPAGGRRLPQLDTDGRYAGDAFILEFVGVLAGAIPDDLPQPQEAVHEQVVPGLRLLGYQRGSKVVATGERAGLALWWEATRQLPPLTTRLELLRPDNTGRILIDTQPVHDSYPYHLWYTPQFLIDQLDPQIPVDFPAGSYRLQLRILDAADKTVFTTGLGSLSITTTERDFSLPPMQFDLDAVFGNEVILAGYDIESTGANQFNLRLIWQAQQPPASNYTVFVHVLDLDGVCCVWQQDVMPRQNQYPTGRWLAEEVVADNYQIDLPDELAAGKYPVEVGLYIAETGQRLQVTAADGPVGDVVYLRPLPLE